jgi:hypothetical protein
MKSPFPGYDEKGYAEFRGALSKNVLDELRSAMETLFGAYAKPGEDIHQTCTRLDKENKDLLYKIYLLLPKTLAMDAVKRECLKFVKEQHPSGAYADIGSGILFGLPHDTRLTWTWHQECTYHPTIPKIVHFWFPIFGRADQERGTMSCLEGSHKLGILPYDAVKPHERGGTSLIPKGIDKFEKEYKEHFFSAEPGDLVIIDKDLIHKSNRNNSDKVRFTGVLRIAVLDKVPEKFDFTHLGGN